ncbi:MAG TPA: hypothetical protein VLH56_01705 [Dissulfurispiraceae bacterium]|nr:hypothetical protein [Dissulfurispiraceae bacterium]
MGRPKSNRKEQIIAEYQRQMRLYGHANFCAITRAVGLKSNVGSYAKRVIQKWLGSQPDKGTVRECLRCDTRFLSTGKHHRLCDACRFDGEYAAPYGISPAIHFAGLGRY